MVSDIEFSNRRLEDVVSGVESHPACLVKFQHPPVPFRVSVSKSADALQSPKAKGNTKGIG